MVRCARFRGALQISEDQTMVATVKVRDLMKARAETISKKICFIVVDARKKNNGESGFLSQKRRKTMKNFKNAVITAMATKAKKLVLSKEEQEKVVKAIKFFVQGEKEIAFFLLVQEEKTMPILKAGMKAARKAALEA